jgi:hypothetical protein
MGNFYINKKAEREHCKVSVTEQRKRVRNQKHDKYEIAKCNPTIAKRKEHTDGCQTLSRNCG